MATVAVRPLSFASSPTLFGGAITSYLGSAVATGDTDGGVCIQTLSDGKTLNVLLDGITFSSYQVGWYFEDDGTIPINAQINSVEITISHIANAAYDSAGSALAFYDTAIDFYNFGAGSIDFTLATASTGVFTINPITNAPWERADLFNDGDASSNGHGGFLMVVNITGFPTINEVLDAITLYVDYGGSSNPQIRAYDGYTDRVFARIPNAT